MRNNTRFWWKCWLLLLFVVTSSCGGEPGLLVRLAAWPEGAENLRVVRWFDGEKQMKSSFPNPKGSVASLSRFLKAPAANCGCKSPPKTAVTARSQALRSQRG
jgi:hypothetical protein